MILQIAFNYRDELQIGGIFIRIYNDMPTFPIANPKQFIIDLLEYLKQLYLHVTTFKNNNTSTTSSLLSSPTGRQQQNTLPYDGILVPTLASNHPKLQQKTTGIADSKAAAVAGGCTFDEALNAYNRSKSRKRLEADAMQEQQLAQKNCRHDFANDVKLEEHAVMALRALMSVIKSNAEVEIQCIGSFPMIFNFLANNLFSDVSML